MIRSFADKETERLFSEGASKKLPPETVRRAVRKFGMLDATMQVEDLRLPLSNRLHRLQGNRQGQYSLSVNDQWRICFEFRGNDAFNVEICDYH